jgi:hypothetical protein
MLDLIPEIARAARDILKTKPRNLPPEQINENFVFAVDIALRNKARELGIKPRELKERLGGFYEIYRAVLLM